MSGLPVSLFLPQVTRIPIAGPAPYNTLVCCTFGGVAFVNGNTGYLTRGQATLGSGFMLQGFDQRVPPIFEHSTTAYLSIIGPSEDDTWLYAIDAIADAGFDPATGQFQVLVDYAVMFGHVPLNLVTGLVVHEYFCCICSYVLVYEPPLPSQTTDASQSSSRFGPLRHPAVKAARSFAGLGKTGAITASMSWQETGKPTAS